MITTILHITNIIKNYIKDKPIYQAFNNDINDIPNVPKISILNFFNINLYSA